MEIQNKAISFSLTMTGHNVTKTAQHLRITIIFNHEQGQGSLQQTPNTIYWYIQILGREQPLHSTLKGETCPRMFSALNSLPQE